MSVWEVRQGEGRAFARFIAIVVLLIAALTTLETARDALLLTHLPARFLGLVYVAVALVALPAAALSALRGVVVAMPQWNCLTSSPSSPISRQTTRTGMRSRVTYVVITTAVAGGSSKGHAIRTD